jgi:uncharacterized membrane protein YedE/YeeE
MPTTRPYLFLSVAVFAVLVVSSWLGLVPRVMTSSTFAWVAAVALALYTVTLMSLKSGQSTESVAQILHDAETKGAASHRQ